MTSSLSDERLFFSSSPTQIGSKPVQEVELLVRNAQNIDHVDAEVEAILFNNTGAFFNGFLRRVELIKSRSQAFQDCHVTVYDKALLILTQNGNELNHPPAISFYCEEFLGIPSHASSSYKESIVRSSMISHSARSQAPSPPETRTTSISTKDAVSLSPDKQSYLPLKNAHDSTTLAELAARLGPLTTRVWAVCERAKEDFFAIEDPKSLAKQSAAKYLRDSAENVLHHLADKNPDPRLLIELEEILAVSKHIAMVLHGGKKRKFDQPESFHGRNRSQHGMSFHQRSRDQPDENRRPDRHVGSRYTDGSADLFPAHESRTNKDPRSSYAPRTRAHDRFFVPELNDKPAYPSRKAKKHPPGRGHSKIPYGYSRQVDKYQPAR